MTDPVHGRPITKLLIANRGEIACRVARTARTMSIATVALYSDADAGALHVRSADEAVHLPGVSASDTYLHVGAVLGAVQRSGADAVHPGYGFLSEHAGFAAACADAGITFVGPPVAAIDAMGNKVEAKTRMAAAGVPVLPGAKVGAGTDDVELLHAGQQVGYPLLVKAAFGGGGRGMRIVASPTDLVAAVASAQREAAAAFGDGLVFLERYVSAPRHVEVQVFADHHGNVVHLFERECSIQRRHQKVIEEAPSAAVDAELRARLGATAVAAARAIGYVGAGTVEFILAPTKEFFFLEVNTRLQVEHPVTEMITGLDLVRLQLEVATGAPLPPDALEPRRHGHAVEARLYAEDVPGGFLPTSGRLRTVELGAAPDAPAYPVEDRSEAARVRVRVDGGYTSGDAVTTYYDAMLAKVITWAPTRAEAVARLAQALRRARVHGVVTNRDLLVRTLEHFEFVAGEIDTAFYERHDPVALGASLVEQSSHLVHALAATIMRAVAGASPHLAGVPYGYRNVGAGWQHVEYRGNLDCALEFRRRRDGVWQVRSVDDVAREAIVVDVTVAAGTITADVVIDEVLRRYTLAQHDDELFVDSVLGASHLMVASRFPSAAATVAQGSLRSPLPGTVVQVGAAVGDHVHSGSVLVVLEAMKMEHAVRAPHDGVVRELRVVLGGQVETGAVLVVVEPVRDDATEDATKGTR